MMRFVPYLYVVLVLLPCFVVVVRGMFDERDRG